MLLSAPVDHQRPYRPADAVAGRRRHHARLPDGVHADGHGCLLHLAGLRARRLATDARPDGAGGLQGDGQRRPDLDPAVRLHGLPGRAGEPDREAVQEPAPGAGARAGLAGGRNARHLRDVRDRDRHRRRRGHADGAAGAAGDAACRLQRAAVGRRDHGGRLSRHPDSAVGAADRLRRDRGCLGGQALRRGLLSRAHAGRALHPVCDPARQDQAESCAATLGSRPGGAAARAAGCGRCHGRPPRRADAAVRRSRAGATPTFPRRTCSSSLSSPCCRCCCSSSLR